MYKGLLLLGWQVFSEGKNWEKIQRAANCVKWTDNICMGNTVKYIIFYYKPLQLLICTVVMVTAISGTEPEICSMRNISSSLLKNLYLQRMKHLLIPVPFRAKLHMCTSGTSSMCILKNNGNPKGFWLRTQGNLHANYTFANLCQGSAEFSPSTTPIYITLVGEGVCWKVMVKSCPVSTLL